MRRRRPSPRVAIVGSGFGGIAAAAKLKFAGIDSFTVFEQSAGPGGTWFDNTYPGCEVDIPSRSYSYSFFPYDWKRTHGTQPELQQYAEDTIDAFGLRAHFRFSCRVEEARWDDAQSIWMVRIENGEEHPFDILASAVGILNVPRYPTWPGMSDFEGIMFHTARWEHEHDLKGKRIALVGTGSSGCQIAPELAKVAERLYIFQREPGWIMHKGERDFTQEERDDLMNHPLRRKYMRWRAFRQTTKRVAAREVGSEGYKRLTQSCLDFIERAIGDPETRKLVTPDYPLGCKRIVQDSKFYDCLNLPNVELVPRAVDSVTRDGLVDVDGVERNVDVIVQATGFRAQEFLGSLPVVGPGGKSLQEHWKGEARAYLGVTVPSFPNFFLFYGPNTNGGGSIIAQHERQGEVLTHAAKRMWRRGYDVVDTKQRALDRFVTWIDKQNRAKWNAVYGGCNNYYLSPSGNDINHWPLTQLRYLVMTRLGPLFAFKYRRADARTRVAANGAQSEQAADSFV